MKETQGHLVAIAQYLMVLYQNRLEGSTGVGDGAEDPCRAARLGAMERAAKEAGRAALNLVLALRHALRDGLTEEAAVPRLASPVYRS